MMNPGDQVDVVCRSCSWVQEYTARERSTERPRTFCCNRCGAHQEVQGAELDGFTEERQDELTGIGDRSTVFVPGSEYGGRC